MSTLLVNSQIVRRVVDPPGGSARGEPMLLEYLLTWSPLLLVYLAFALPCLLALRARAMDDTSRALWVLVIVSAPVLGPLAFVLLRPGTRA